MRCFQLQIVCGCAEISMRDFHYFTGHADSKTNAHLEPGQQSFFNATYIYAKCDTHCE